MKTIAALILVGLVSACGVSKDVVHPFAQDVQTLCEGAAPVDTLTAAERQAWLRLRDKINTNAAKLEEVSK